MGNYDREPLDELEEVLGVFYGGYGQVGQQFVVTNRRLLLAPIKLIKGLEDKVALDAVAYVAGKLNVPGVDLIKEILQNYAPFQPRTIWLRHIVSVEAGGNGGGPFRAPTVKLVTDTEDEEILSVIRMGTGALKLFTPNWSPRNGPERDRMVAVLQAAVASAKMAPPPVGI